MTEMMATWPSCVVLLVVVGVGVRIRSTELVYQKHGDMTVLSI